MPGSPLRQQGLPRGLGALNLIRKVCPCFRSELFVVSLSESLIKEAITSLFYDTMLGNYILKGSQIQAALQARATGQLAQVEAFVFMPTAGARPG